MSSWMNSWWGCFAASFNPGSSLTIITFHLSFLYYPYFLFTRLSCFLGLFSLLSTKIFFFFNLPLNSKSFSLCCLQLLSNGYFFSCFLSHFSRLPVILELFIYTNLGAFPLFLFFKKYSLFWRWEGEVKEKTNLKDVFYKAMKNIQVCEVPLLSF